MKPLTGQFFRPRRLKFTGALCFLALCFVVLWLFSCCFAGTARGGVLEEEDRVIYRNFDAAREPTKAQRHQETQEELAREILKDLYINVEIPPQKRLRGGKPFHPKN